MNTYILVIVDTQEEWTWFTDTLTGVNKVVDKDKADVGNIRFRKYIAGGDIGKIKGFIYSAIVNPYNTPLTEFEKGYIESGLRAYAKPTKTPHNDVLDLTLT